MINDTDKDALQLLIDEANKKNQELSAELEKSRREVKRYHEEVMAQREFLLMINDEMKQKNKVLENKNGEIQQKSQEIHQQNEEIQQQNEEIMMQRDYLVQLNEAISKQKEELEEKSSLLQDKNNAITASINYSARIQKAMLPELNTFERLFHDYLVFYVPRDIVSGDFYWLHEYIDEHTGSTKVIVAAGDCTGHGVPGALLSMLGYQLLNDVVVKREIHQPARILTELNIALERSLKQTLLSGRDSIDMAVAVWDKNNDVLTTASAKSAIYYFQGNQTDLIEIKGDRFSVGGNIDNKRVAFSDHTIDLKKGKVNFYMTSDGYRDQFGGPYDKKFTGKRLRQLLIDNQARTMYEQRNLLAEELREWMSSSVLGYRQTDDIMLIGFCVGAT